MLTYLLFVSKNYSRYIYNSSVLVVVSSVLLEEENDCVYTVENQLE